jgi:hypothetical protein
VQEGWHGDDYLIVFSEAEAVSASDRYEISKFLPGYQIVGLRGWDDFILRDSAGRTYAVPTVPLVPEYVSQFSLTGKLEMLELDERFSGKIKWYIKPIVFGGKADLPMNMAWITHDQHVGLVKWWNDLYRSVKPSS